MWQLISPGSHKFSLFRSKLSHYSWTEMNCLGFILFFLFACYIRLDTTPVSILPSLGMKLHEQTTWDLCLWLLSYSSPVEAEWQLRGKELRCSAHPIHFALWTIPACSLLCAEASAGDPVPGGQYAGRQGSPTAQLWISALGSACCARLSHILGFCKAWHDSSPLS